MLLPYQKINLEKLSSMVKENTNLTIVGKENSGRKYIIEQWSQSKKNPLIINLEKNRIKLRICNFGFSTKKNMSNRKT